MSIAEAMVGLADMTVSELRQRYAEVFGETITSRHKRFLCKRIIWRMQAQAEGGLSERARARAKELANDAELRVFPPKQINASANVPARRKNPRLPMPGTVITRRYRGETIEVRVLRNGFEYGGEVYRTLSAVAKAVTGTHWNGYHFFNLTKKGVCRND
jgi:hypothetical protein